MTKGRHDSGLGPARYIQLMPVLTRSHDSQAFDLAVDAPYQSQVERNSGLNEANVPRFTKPGCIGFRGAFPAPALVKCIDRLLIFNHKFVKEDFYDRVCCRHNGLISMTT